MKPISICLLGCLLLVPAVVAQDAVQESARVRSEERVREAARSGEAAVIQRLLDEGVDVNAANRYRMTALYYAADRGDVASVELLLAAGAEVEIPNEPYYRLSPMIMAARKNHADVVQRLLDAGAQCGGWTAIWPASLGHSEVVEVLVTNRPDTFDQPVLDQLLSIATSAGNAPLVEFLTRKGAQQTATDQPVEKPFATLTPEECGLLDGIYQPVTGDGPVRIWVRDGKLFLGDELELAAPLRQADDFRFAITESDQAFVDFLKPLGRRLELIKLGNAETADETNAYVRSAPVAADLLGSRPEASVRESSGAKLALNPVAHWSRFRGPDGAGIADGFDLPTDFDATNGIGVAWKTPVAGVGHSSPVIWEDKVIVTSATPVGGEPSYELRTSSGFDTHRESIDYRWDVTCINLFDGSIRWTVQLHVGRPVAQRHIMSSHANCTPAINGDSIVVSLAGEGVYCLDHDGKLRWRKDLGKLAAGWFIDSGYEWGFASSPVIDDGLVYLQCDVFEGAFLSAMRLTDGNELWRTPREEWSSWGTPLIMTTAAGKQVIANGTKAICGYDASTGTELWRVLENSEVTVASPIPNGNQVLVTGGYKPIDPIFSIDPVADADAIAEIRASADGSPSIGSGGWFRPKGGAYMVTPLVYDNQIYFFQSSGVMTCLRSDTGEPVFKARVAGGRSGDIVASPIACDGKIFVAGSHGDVFVLDAGDQYQRPIVCPVGEPIMATPAAAPGRLIVRGKDHVYCFTKNE